LAALGAILPARAAGPADDKKPQAIQLQAVALPVVVDNRLINYVFVTVKLDLALGADGAQVRAKEPFFRDALVRAGHHAPFTLASDYAKLDVGKIRAAVLKDAPAIIGPGMVRDVEVVKQVPQHQMAKPPPHAQKQAAEPVQPQGPEIIP
jgi:hypothetical protein